MEFPGKNRISANLAPDEIQGSDLVPLILKHAKEIDGLPGARSTAIAASGASRHVMKNSPLFALIL